eukprot:PLAT1609.3.p1 GENE.PLAT1609.3~~PLAT1609.3.p1  ORF type:complete len:255 (+),score=5.99 PLAT1609.3:30-794(+)
MGAGRSREAVKRMMKTKDLEALKKFVAKYGKDASVMVFGGDEEPLICHVCKWRFTEGLMWLIEQGVIVHARGKDGRVALHNAHSAAVVEALVAAGADVNASGDYGITPLHWACQMAWDGTVAALLAAGARLNAVTEYGHTPLMVCSIWDHVNCMMVLLAAGADTTLKSQVMRIVAPSARSQLTLFLPQRGETAEEMATKKKHPEAAAIIRAEEASRAASAAEMEAAESMAAEAHEMEGDGGSGGGSSGKVEARL